jgi:hypothetical protein
MSEINITPPSAALLTVIDRWRAHPVADRVQLVRIGSTRTMVAASIA